MKIDKVNYAVPGDPMTQEELQQMIHEAENGKFHSVHTVKQKIDRIGECMQGAFQVHEGWLAVPL
ncbi:hypothetical protein [Parapedobacter tibetensis]|uniref:hypothetical protein n=1 Tax=Parapedobacter tibetensis TaxID=2972951 RepID=UPI00214D6DDF|nr:hypothetical protein [Parapedobacter tibetensis]